MANRTRRTKAAVLVAFLAGALPDGALAAGVIVVRSSDLAPYRAVESSFVAAVGVPTLGINLAASDAARRMKEVAGAGVVFAIGPEAARAAAALGPRAMLFALVPDPQKAGLAARTPGVPMFVSPARQLEVIRALMPRAKRLGVIYDPELSKQLVLEYERAASAGGMSLVRGEVASRKDVARAVRALVESVDAMWLLPDPTVLGADSFKFMMQTCIESAVPIVGFSAGMAKAGAVLAVEAGFDEMGRKAAGLAKRLLADASTGIDAPEGAVYLNARSAAMLGVSIPPALRGRAALVFE